MRAGDLLRGRGRAAIAEEGRAAEPDAPALKRRLERERRARAEAEAISERALRELYENQQTVERLRLQNQTLLDSAGEGIFGLETDGTIRFVNPAAASILGWDGGELVGGAIHELVHATIDSKNGHSAEGCPLLACASESGRTTTDDTFLRSDGSGFPVEYICMPLIEGERTTGIVLTFNDISERKRFESQLQYLADHDALTGLFNRRRFEEELSRQVAYTARYGQGAALLLLDLDNFKQINDTLGHPAGDELLTSVSSILRRRLRETDILARLGGDEFAVLLARAELEQAVAIGQELAELVASSVFASGNRPMRITTSIGIAPLGEKEVSAPEALMRADMALYDAKGHGRNRVSLYTAETGERAKKEGGLAWSERIRQALDTNRFVLFWQPIVDLRTDEVSQHELLLRMHGMDGDLIPPGAFLPTAERFGLIREVDRWVVREAIRFVAKLREAGDEADVLVEINLSGKSVGDPELPQLIERELAATSVRPRSLIFEITETAAIANMDEARRFANRLASLGCRFALDDFGAGFGSFYYLKHFHLDYLKIDGEFVRNLPNSPMDQRVVRAMVEVGRSLGMKTIAEFVEDEEILEMLREFNVDYGQGFHLGRPTPIAEMVTAKNELAG